MNHSTADLLISAVPLMGMAAWLALTHYLRIAR